MTLASALAAADRTLLVQTSFRNKLINGDFDFWQRGIAQSVSGFGSDDRWSNEFVGASVAHSRQDFPNTFTTIPGFPRYYSRSIVTSAAGANNFARKVQRIEDVGTLAGRKAVLTFWARGSSALGLGIDFAHRWGLGLFSYFAPNKVTLTTSWQKYKILVDVPPLTGTIGTGYRGSVHLRFWFDAGSNSNAYTNSLGHQSGTFDIAQVQFEEGDHLVFGAETTGLSREILEGGTGEEVGIPMLADRRSLPQRRHAGRRALGRHAERGWVAVGVEVEEEARIEGDHDPLAYPLEPAVGADCF